MRNQAPDSVTINNIAKHGSRDVPLCRGERRRARRAGLHALIPLGCLLALLLCLRSAGAESTPKKHSRSYLDVVLLFDASGSMLKTDPQNLRYQGAKVLLSFLEEGDRLGIVQFAGTAKVVQELEPFAPKREDYLADKIQAIAAEGAFTDIAEGVKLAKTLLETNPRADSQRIIVLLSDGKVEPDPKVSPAFARTLELVHDILPDLKVKETRVFTLAFSEQADRAFLAEVAAATDSLTWFTQTADDIHKSFAELFLAVKRPQIVAQSGRGFRIDADVAEATFYINHEPEEVLEFISPKGAEYTGDNHPEFITWFKGKKFDVVTISAPDEGNWQVLGTDNHDGFATVLTNLKLLTDWPLVIRAGDEPLVQSRLYENDKPVSIPEMSEVLKIGFQIIPTDKISQPIAQEPLNDEARRGDKMAQDGIFSSIAQPMQPGAYKLVVVAKGPTFQRSQQIPFNVRPRLVTLEVKQDRDAFGDEERSKSGEATHDETKGAEAGESEEPTPSPGRIETKVAGDENAVFVIQLSKEAIGLKNLEVKLLALSEDRERIDIPLKRGPGASKDFAVEATALPKDGTYKLKALIRGDVKKGEAVEAESPTITFSLKSKVQRALPKEVDKHHGEEPHDKEAPKPLTSKLPLVPIVIISVFNVAAFVTAFSMLRKKRKKTDVASQKYVPQKQLLEAIATLEERVSTSAIELDDPIFLTLDSDEKGVDGEEVAQEPPAEAATPTQESGEAG